MLVDGSPRAGVDRETIVELSTRCAAGRASSCRMAAGAIERETVFPP
jgi:hypothetical protein